MHNIYELIAEDSAEGSSVPLHAVQYTLEQEEERLRGVTLDSISDVLLELKENLKPLVLSRFMPIAADEFKKLHATYPVQQAICPELKKSCIALCRITLDPLKLCLGLHIIPTHFSRISTHID